MKQPGNCTYLKRLLLTLLLMCTVCFSIAAPVYAAEDEAGVYLTWDEYKEASGVTSWNYNDMAQVISQVAEHAYDLYMAGDLDEAYEYAKATYWGYYETSGFERNTMNYISGARVSQVELSFTTLRKAIKKDKGEAEVRAAVDELVGFLLEDALILSPEGPVFMAGASGATGGGAAVSNGDVSVSSAPGVQVEVSEYSVTDDNRLHLTLDVTLDLTEAGNVTVTRSSGGSVGSGIAVFLGSFGIILREGLEAILIVGAIIAYLVKTGNQNKVRPVYIGSALAVACSFIMAAILNYLLSKSAEYHMSQEIIEGIAALTAVVVLFWVSNWMVSKSEAAAWSGYIESKAQAGAKGGSVFALAFTAWLAVFREGAEVILFYQPMLREDRPDMVWAGFFTGVICLVVVFLLIRFLSIRLPLKPFFMATSILMAAMSISFLGAGIKELMEGGVFDNMEWALSSPKWLSWIPYNDTLDVLGIYPLVGTIVPQLILLAITIVTFVLHLRAGKKIQRQADSANEEEAQPQT